MGENNIIRESSITFDCIAPVKPGAIKGVKYGIKKKATTEINTITAKKTVKMSFRYLRASGVTFSPLIFAAIKGISTVMEARDAMQADLKKNESERAQRWNKLPKNESFGEGTAFFGEELDAVMPANK